MILQGKATNHIWFMEDGEEPHVIGVRLDCGDSGVVYFTREQAADLSKGLSNFLAEAALRAETPTPPLEDQSLDDALDARFSLEGTLTAIVVRLNCAQKVRDLTEAEEEILQMARESFQPRAETPAPRECKSRFTGGGRCEKPLGHTGDCVYSWKDRVFIPVSAFRWLMGEEGDFMPPAGKHGTFWWRSEFRKRIEAAGEPEQAK